MSSCQSHLRSLPPHSNQKFPAAADRSSWLITRTGRDLPSHRRKSTSNESTGSTLHLLCQTSILISPGTIRMWRQICCAVSSELLTFRARKSSSASADGRVAILICELLVNDKYDIGATRGIDILPPFSSLSRSALLTISRDWFHGRCNEIVLG